MAVWGLALSIVGVIILAWAQSRLDRAIQTWILALDFTIETLTTPGHKPIMRFSGMEEQVKATVKQNRWIAPGGWLLVGIGFVLQLIPLLKS